MLHRQFCFIVSKQMKLFKKHFKFTYFKNTLYFYLKHSILTQCFKYIMIKSKKLKKSFCLPIFH